ncbi:MAG: hypothetical protein ABIM98_00730 [candidate division WOR-3 bacterium]
MIFLKILIIINFFEFRPHFNKGFIFIPYEINYLHYGSYGVATDNVFSVIYDNPFYDIGLSFFLLFDEGIDSRIFYAEKIVMGGYGVDLFLQKKFIGGNKNLFLPFDIKLSFEDFYSQLRTINSFKPSFKFSPSYYQNFSKNLKPGIKLEGIYNIQGERDILVLNPLIDLILFPQKILSLSISLNYKNLFSSGLNYSYPEVRLTLFSNPLLNIFLLLQGFLSLKSGENPFSGGLKGDYLYGEPVLKEGAGFKFLLGFVIYPEKKRKIQIFVKDEEGKYLSPNVEENPAIGFERRKEGFYEKINLKPDTYLVRFGLEGYRDTSIYLYPEEIEKDLAKYFITMKKIELREEIEKPLTIERTDFYFYFDSAKAEIKEIYGDTFDLILKIIKESKKDTVNLLVRGNASPEGDTLFNRRLSFERANRVFNFLNLLLYRDVFILGKVESEYDSKTKVSDLPKSEWKYKRRVHLKILK